MQRIDENTYIDDTLVTCAEYQLFIDEMREQGKYFQPDHWTTYQCPEGQTRKPIFGVRHSDAATFCEWLTQRQTGEWKYRLPTQNEARKYQIQLASYQSPIGYWLIRALKYDFDDFFLVGSIPINVGGTTFNHSTQGADLAIKLANTINIGLPRSTADDIGYLLYYALEKRAVDLDCDLAFARDHDCYIGYDRGVIKSIDDALTNILALTHSLYERLFQWQTSITLKQFINSRVGNEAYDFFYALVMYMDILTLQERIAGRSPAFEGIRLVKERTK